MSDETLEAAIKKTLSSVRAMCNAITRYYDEITKNINEINENQNSDKGN